MVVKSVPVQGKKQFNRKRQVGRPLSVIILYFLHRLTLSTKHCSLSVGVLVCFGDPLVQHLTSSSRCYASGWSILVDSLLYLCMTIQLFVSKCIIIVSASGKTVIVPCECKAFSESLKFFNLFWKASFLRVFLNQTWFRIGMTKCL